MAQSRKNNNNNNKSNNNSRSSKKNNNSKSKTCQSRSNSELDNMKYEIAKR